LNRNVSRSSKDPLRNSGRDPLEIPTTSQALSRRLLSTCVIVASFIVAHPAEAEIVTGSYSGNSTDGHQITGLGFQPDLVLVHRNTLEYAYFATKDSVVDGGTGDLKTGRLSSSATYTNRILSLDENGFTLGTDADVNASSNPNTYYFLAIKYDSNMWGGSYTGNATDDTDISCCGSDTPNAVITFRETSLAPQVRSDATSPSMTTSSQFNAVSTDLTDRIKSFGSGTFRIGTENAVNASGVTFSYVAFKTSSYFETGSYTGNATTARSITTTIDPAAVFITCDSQIGSMRLASMGSATGASYRLNSGTQSDMITALGSGSFTVGNSVYSNDNSAECYYLAFEENNPALAVRLRSLVAWRSKKGLVVRWITGLEVDNLGFHVEGRSANGQVLPLTSSLVAGSSLFGHTPAHPSSNARDYSITVPRHRRASPVQQVRLKSVDLRGRIQVSDWHSVSPSAPKTGEALAKSPARMLDAVGQYSSAESKAQRASYEKLVGPVAKGVVKLPDTQPHRNAQGNSKGWRYSASALSPIERQRMLAADDGFKITVKHSGWVSITGEELLDAGLPAGTAVDTLRVFDKGVQIPIRIISKEDELNANKESGVLNTTDAVQFYSPPPGDPQADSAIYWLSAGTSLGEPSLRIESDTAPSVSASALTYSGRATATALPKTVYVAAINDDDGDNFFGPLISENALDYDLQLNDVDLTAPQPAVVTVTLKGLTKGLTHHVAVLLNDSKIGELDFQSQSIGSASFEVPQSQLKEGDNRFTLAALPSDTASALDKSFLKEISVDYWQLYRIQAKSKLIEISADTTAAIKMPFANTGEFFELNDAGQLSQILPTRFEIDRGQEEARIAAGPKTKRIYIRLPTEIEEVPAKIERNGPSQLQGQSDGNDFIIVSASPFVEAANELANWKRQLGWNPIVVNIDDVYDEFSYGQSSVKALRDYLHYAFQFWNQPPSHVLLLGDASFDREGRLELGAHDYVPTRLLYVPNLETASDDWLVDFNDDQKPEIAIGRLPARTPEQAMHYVQRIIDHEGSRSDTEQKHRFVLAHEKTPVTTRTVLKASVDKTWDISEFDISAQNAQAEDQSRNGIVDIFDNTPDVLLYYGHGSVGIWGQKAIVDQSLVDLFGDSKKLPVVVSLTCLNGFFHDIYTTSLAETLVGAPKGGAIAVFASSMLNKGVQHVERGKTLIRNLTQTPTLTIGEAARLSKQDTADRGRRHWLLFGDPTLRLEEPPVTPDPPPLSVDAGPPDSACDVGHDSQPPLVDPPAAEGCAYVGTGSIPPWFIGLLVRSAPRLVIKHCDPLPGWLSVIVIARVHADPICTAPTASRLWPTATTTDVSSNIWPELSSRFCRKSVEEGEGAALPS
jgi:hypothetical protein